jgi:acetyl esterase
MPIEPDILRLINEFPEDEIVGDDDFAARRILIADLISEVMAAYPVGQGFDLDAVAVSEQIVEHDGQVIPIRVFVPPASGPLPVYVFFFGGGWWMRNFDAPDVVDSCRQTAIEAGVIVIEVDYALAPEHPYPAALEQGAALLDWLARGETGFPIDPSRIGVGGTSAGGNIAAALCLLTRDRGGPVIQLQVLEVPALDGTFAHYDATVFEAHPPVEWDGDVEAACVSAWNVYLPPDTDRRDPHVSPLLADDLSGLPPALILTAEFDPFWVEGVAYAAALLAAGTPAAAVTYSGQVHGAPSYSAVSASSRAWRSQVSAAVATLKNDV